MLSSPAIAATSSWIWEEGHMLIVTLWESESTAHAAREALEPEGDHPSQGLPVLIRVTQFLI